MKPLAERMRPQTLDDFVGQEHLVGNGAALRRMIESNTLPSFILWGPPGVGKTTIASILSATLKRPFFNLSAINSGVKDVRETIAKAENSRFPLKDIGFSSISPLLAHSLPWPQSCVRKGRHAREAKRYSQ